MDHSFRRAIESRPRRAPLARFSMVLQVTIFGSWLMNDWRCYASAVLVALWLAPEYAPAQTTSTEILGTVTDASGAAMSGATVTIFRAAMLVIGDHIK